MNTLTPRDKYLRKEYGITEAEYMKMLKVQDGKCALCGQVPKPTTNLHVDHEHVLGYQRMPPEERRKYVRGLLDYRCNKFKLGRTTLSDARRIFEYLENPPARRVLK